MPRTTFRQFVAWFCLLFLLPVLASAEIIINEIMYNPAGSDSSRDWLELYNNGSESVTVKGGTAGTDSWRIYQESSTGSTNNRTFGTTAYQGDMTVGVGEYVIVAIDGAAFKGDYPSFTGKILTAGAMSLTSTASQKVGLRLGSSGSIWSLVTYSSDQGANDDGNSLQLQSSGNWIATAPTPGAANSSSVATSTEEESNQTSTTTSQSETSSNSSSSSSSGSTNSTATSAHYSAAALSSKKPAPALSLSAGRDRLGSVGSPMEFKADANFEYTRNGTFTWNFGDGTQEAGEILTHTYEYPGEYIVVLNADFPEGRGVARTNVKVIDPKVVITSADAAHVGIRNNSDRELSLYGRALLSGGQVFLFPRDTLIPAGHEISFSAKVTRLFPASLNDIQVVVVGQTEQPKIREKIEEVKKEKITFLQSQLTELEVKLASMQQTQSLPPPLAVATSSRVSEEVINLRPEEASSVAAAAQSGWWKTFKNFLLGKKELKELK